MDRSNMIRKTITGLSIVFLLLVLPLISHAEPPQAPLDMPALPGSPSLTPMPGIPSPGHVKGMISATGTRFEIIDSDYLNVVLVSSESVTLRVESVPNVVIIYLEPSTLTAETQLTISGLKPETVYHLYQDDYHNHRAITTDQDGRYTFIQDTTSNHTVFIQPRKSTKFINDNASGGDCQTIGIWDASTRTCTLTVDVNEAMEIDSDNLTLNGNGHVITGTNNNWSGIYLPGRKNVTLANLTVTNFSYGIVMDNAKNITLQNCTITNNTNHGIRLQVGLGSGSDYITITNSTITNNYNGIWAFGAAHVVITNNTISNNRGYGISAGTRGTIITNNSVQDNRSADISLENTFCDDVIENNTGSGGKPIKYFNAAVTVQNEELSQLILCNADYSIVENVTVHGSDVTLNNGIYLLNTDFANLTGINSYGNYMGLRLHNANNNTITASSFSRNAYGIYFSGVYMGTGSSNNTMTNNDVSNNGYQGIFIAGSGNTLLNTTVLNNGIGVIVQSEYYSYTVSNNTLKYNTISNNSYYGVALRGMINSVVSDNVIVNNGRYGIWMWDCSNDTLTNNIVQEHSEFDLHFEWQSSSPFKEEYCTHTIQNNTGSGGRMIRYVSANESVDNEVVSELLLCNADQAVVNRVTVNGSDTLKNNGIVLIKTDYAMIADSLSIDNNYGLVLAYSTNNRIAATSLRGNLFGSRINYSSQNTLAGNSMEGSSYVALEIYQSGQNTFKDNIVKNMYSGQGDVVTVGDGSSGNTFLNNSAYSLRLMSATSSNTLIQGNTLTMLQIMGNDNTATENTIGSLPYGGGSVSVYMASNTRVYHNNFLGSRAMLSNYYGGSNNVFDLAKPTGGNYWSDYDTPSEGCTDADGDGFCDAPYPIADWYNVVTGADNLPWARQNGWNLPKDTTPPVTAIALSGTAGTNDWYVSDVGVTLTATDDAGGTGVKELHYAVDGVETVVAGGTAAISITTEGTYSLSYYSIDNAENSETAHALTIKIDKTPPVITGAANPGPNAQGWNNGPVTVTFTCSDLISGVLDCTSPLTFLTEGMNQTAAGIAVDKAGLSASVPASVNIDTTAPVITATVTPAPNANGWNNTDVTITFTCNDGLSGMSVCPAPVTVTTEGAGQVITGGAIDNAGNAADATVVLNIDKTPPTVASLAADPSILWPPNHKMKDVTISGSASDSGAGVASVSISVSDEYGIFNMSNLGFGDVIQLEAWRKGTDTDGRRYVITGVITDKAGNQATVSTMVLVPHDRGDGDSHEDHEDDDRNHDKRDHGDQKEDDRDDEKRDHDDRDD